MPVPASFTLADFFKIHPEDSPERFLPEEVLQLVRFCSAPLSADECTRMDSFLFRHTYAALRADDAGWVDALQTLCELLTLNVSPPRTPAAPPEDIAARTLAAARFELLSQLLESRSRELRLLSSTTAGAPVPLNYRSLAQQRAKRLVAAARPA